MDETVIKMEPEIESTTIECVSQQEQPDEGSTTRRTRQSKARIAWQPRKSMRASTRNHLKVENSGAKQEIALRDSPSSSPRLDDFERSSSPQQYDENPEADNFNEVNDKTAMKAVLKRCKLCRKKVELRDEDDETIHLKLVHENLKSPFLGPYRCENYGKARHCTKLFPHEIRIRKHIRQFHLFKNEKLCTTCGATFYDRRSFYCHIDKNHGIRNKTCSVCGKMFAGVMNLNKHLQTHLDSSQRKVAICDR